MAEETSTIGEHITNLIRHRKHQHQQQSSHRHSASSSTSSRTDLSSSIMCKPSISSLFISPFTNPENTHMRNTSNERKKSISLRGLGCTAPPEVTVPGVVVRPSAHWGDQERESNAAADNNKKKKKKKSSSSSSSKKKGKQVMMMMDNINISHGNDLWCGPGFGYDGTVASVDCVNPCAATSSSSSSRPLSHRGKIDLNKPHHRERALYSSRQRVNADNFGTLDLDSAFELPSYGLNILEDRFYHHLRNRTPDGLAEIMMFHNGLLTGRRSGPDRYQDWRLDVDNMTYEELLELGDRIGYVNTGLEEDQILRCLRKTKLSAVDELSFKCDNRFELEGKCSICQDEYEAEDEMGKLKCGHSFHLHCIKFWLSKKNACPVCKAEASSR